MADSGLMAGQHRLYRRAPPRAGCCVHRPGGTINIIINLNFNMNLIKALKEKNRLVNKSNQLFQKIQQYNSVVVGSEQPYDINALVEQWFDTSNQLVALKTKIHLANGPIYSKIFELAELKSNIVKLRAVSTNSGPVVTRDYRGTEQFNYVATISTIQRDIFIQEAEERIETLQSEIEEFNAVTKIN